MDEYDTYTEDLDYFFEEESERLTNEILLNDENPDFQKEAGFEFSFLNERDYSLNSPLISDELNEFLKFIQGQSYRSSWNKQAWNRSAEWIKKLSFRQDLTVSNFHVFVGHLLSTYSVNIRTGKEFSNIVFKNTSASKWIPDAFLSGILKFTPPHKDNFHIRNLYTLKMLSIFLTFHWITQLMNAKGENELASLIEMLTKTRFMKVEKLEDHLILYTDIGKFMVDQNFLLFEREQRLISHTHVLLLKDIVISRFNALAYLEMNIDPIFQNVSLDRIIRIYQLGDEGLIEHGNDWYDRVSLIEPICNHIFVELSSSFRPLIPIDSRFGKFIKAKILELSENCHVCKNFFDELLSTKSLGENIHLYGCFRHWGHPEINYLEGLDKLYKQVQAPKEIKQDYAEALASDLAFLVLRKEFKRNNRWSINRELIPKDHPLSSHFSNNTFPSDAEILSFGDKWHLLPLVACFDVPDVINPSTIYSDKSHSMTRSEVINFLLSSPGQKIPSRRVLSTYLETSPTNWKTFLQQINDFGLSKENLIIGLKAKEREIKKVGRFFALMSWALREYFVVTEYLIKTHFVPLFGGLTMADDFSTVTKKMLDRCNGQGVMDYSQVCYANHIDYEKWNNHQRKESTTPVFRVMGQFLGLPNLISRTHEFFEQSLVYYNNRGDLLGTDGINIFNNSEHRVCWEGQKGGLEGLRQKGWSILNLLVIRREARIRSTKISVLAQGDNQVVCTQYKVQKAKSTEELVQNLASISRNNRIIMDNIRIGTGKLGLIINESETIQGADYLNYGKVPIFRGNICPLPTKRWSRVCCVTNDQLPTMANMMATVVTNALTTANFSVSPVPSIYSLNYFGNFVMLLTICHNPAIRKEINLDSTTFGYFQAGFIFLDPALGGISGANLNRFLIRGFPDPVTESLSFWRIVYRNSHHSYQKDLAGKMTAVSTRSFDPAHFSKLLEDPASLNLVQGISPETTIKEHIKQKLIHDPNYLRNEMIRDVLHTYEQESAEIFIFLQSITPCFPRFLSEFKSSTFVGITDALIGLFQSSKTIRRIFKRGFVKDINKIIIKAENTGIMFLTNLHRRIPIDLTNACTSELADNFRTSSWSKKIFGATVPHPVEMFNQFEICSPNCDLCLIPSNGDYMVTRIRDFIPDKLYTRAGPHPPYLGSKTTESTSILSPWEQESKVPIIEKAKRLRRAIGWFIDPRSNLSSAILNNLESLTGEKWKDLEKDYKRTGSALHRFGSERQSAGGFNAVSPTGLSRVYTTTDFLHNLQKKNYDFMFQPSILFAQITSVASDIRSTESIIHHHLSCRSCVREIEDIKLNTEMNLKLINHSHVLNSWKPNETPWIKESPATSVQVFEWEETNPDIKSFLIGRMQGFAFGILKVREIGSFDLKKLFPQVLVPKLIPSQTLPGILDGLIRASTLHILQRSMLYNSQDPKTLLISAVLDIIHQFSEDEAAQSFFSSPNWTNELNRVPHKTPASFPQNRSDCSYLLLNYLRQKAINQIRTNDIIRSTRQFPIVVFADLNTYDIVLPLGVSNEVLNKLMNITSRSYLLSFLRSRSEELESIYTHQMSETRGIQLLKNIFGVDQEVRHAVKDVARSEAQFMFHSLEWREEEVGLIYITPVIYSAAKTIEIPFPPIPIGSRSPLMSGLRSFQFATGSHYKMRTILQHYQLNPRDFMCLGDGSGGLTSLCLRFYRSARGLFNSLVELKDTPIYGQEPAPPATLISMGSDCLRCLNWNEVTFKPNDLRSSHTWIYLETKSREHNMKIDLVIIDFETDDENRDDVENLLFDNIKNILTKGGTLIYKTYLHRLVTTPILNILGSLFPTIDITQTSFTSIHSSEIYLVCQGSLVQPRLMYPDWSALSLWWSSFFPYQTEECEFERCILIKKKSMMKGIPPQLRLSSDIQLGEVLSLLGVPAGISFRLSQFASRRWNTTTILSILIISNYFTFKASSKAQSHLKIPSDSVCINLLTQLFGFSYYMSWADEDFKRFKYLNYYFSRRIPIMFGDPFQLSKSKRYFIPWSLSTEYDVIKAFYIDKEGSKVTQLIRALHANTYHPLEGSWSEVKKTVETFLPFFSSAFWKINTGVFDLLNMEVLSILVEPNTHETVNFKPFTLSGVQY